jgi:hypothetical protein
LTLCSETSVPSSRSLIRPWWFTAMSLYVRIHMYTHTYISYLYTCIRWSAVVLLHVYVQLCTLLYICTYSTCVYTHTGPSLFQALDQTSFKLGFALINSLAPTWPIDVLLSLVLCWRAARRRTLFVQMILQRGPLGSAFVALLVSHLCVMSSLMMW